MTFDTTGFMPRGVSTFTYLTHLRSRDTTGFMPRGELVSAYVVRKKR